MTDKEQTEHVDSVGEPSAGESTDPLLQRKLVALLVEDSDVDAEVIQAQLADEVEIVRVSSLSECHETGRCDVVLLDLNLRDSMGVETVRQFRKGVPHLPVVVLSHIDDPRTEAACMLAGAHSFYRKENYDTASLVRAMQAAAIAFAEAGERAVEKTIHRDNLEEIKKMTTRILQRLEELE